MFDYDNAGKHAQPEVQAAIARWRARIPVTVKSRLPLLYWLLGEGTDVFKIAKTDAAYGPPPPQFRGAQKCGNCQFAYCQVKTKRHICAQVEGVIETKMWCKLWRG